MAGRGDETSGPAKAKAMIMKQLFDKLITAIEDAVMLFSYVTLIVLVGIEALRRMVTAEQAAWGPEIALYAFVWLTWFSMSSNIRNRRHLSFDELRRRMPASLRTGLEIVDCLLWLGLGVIIIHASTGIVGNNLRMEQVVFGTEIPLWAATVAVPIGWGFSMIRILQELWDLLTGAPRDLPSHQEADTPL